MMARCCAPAARHGCSTRCMRPRRWDLLARVQLRARQPARRGGARASGGAGGAHAVAARHRAACLRGHRLAVAPGLWAPRAGCLVRARQDRQPRAAAAGAVTADHHSLHGAGRAGDRRGAATQWQGRLRAAAAAQIQAAIGTARGCGGTGTIMVRGDSAFGTKKVIATCVEEGVEFSLSVAATSASAPRSGHRRGRLHPGALPGRGGRPRHRGADL